MRQDRFLEIELVTNNVTGLKIPLSSIVTKSFMQYLPNILRRMMKHSNGFMLSGRNKKATVLQPLSVPVSMAVMRSQTKKHRKQAIFIT